MVSYATITGTITAPGGDTGVRAKIIATPQTRGTGISLDDRITWGPATTTTAADGTFDDLVLPLADDPVLWKIIADPITQEQVIDPWTLGVYEVTASGTLHSLVATDYLAITSTVVASVYAARDAAEDAQTATEAARDEASDSAAAALASERSASEIAMGNAAAAFGVEQANPSSPLSVAQGAALDDLTHPLTAGLAAAIAAALDGGAP